MNRKRNQPKAEADSGIQNHHAGRVRRQVGGSLESRAARQRYNQFLYKNFSSKIFIIAVYSEHEFYLKFLPLL
jgi:hypothetical protein